MFGKNIFEKNMFKKNMFKKNMFKRNMFKRNITIQPYDKETQRPVIHSSICTGEQVAGFKDIRTGAFTEVMVIRTGKDMDEFLKRYGVCAEDIRKEW